MIDRRDQTINLCEMKFSQGEFEITKQYDERLRERAEMFRSATKTCKALKQYPLLHFIPPAKYFTTLIIRYEKREPYELIP